MLKTICSPITYDSIKKFVTDSRYTLPVSAENQDKEGVIISEGIVDGNHFYELQTLQKNDWIRVNCYYADGTIDERYKR